MTIQHAVWTFKILGGDPFELQVRHNPSLEHDGTRTIWQLVGSETLADQVKTDIENFGGKVDRFCQQQTDDLLANRLRLPGVPDDPDQ